MSSPIMYTFINNPTLKRLTAQNISRKMSDKFLFELSVLLNGHNMFTEDKEVQKYLQRN